MRIRHKQLLLAVSLLNCANVLYCQISPGTVVTPTASEPGPTGSTVPSGIPPTGSFCEEFELRSTHQTTSVTVGDLVNRGNVFAVEGNIEVCLGGSFYSICDEGWSDDAAQFVCNYFGYDSKIYAGTALRGLTSNLLTIVENVTCPSNVTHPSQCNFISPPVTPRCYSLSSAAGFRCTQIRVPCLTEGQIALISPTYENYLNIYTGGSVTFGGKVGVCRDGVYDSICDVNWDDNDAKVLCRSLGARGSAPLRGLSVGIDPISLEDVNCDGTESNIQNCPTSPIGELSPTCRELNRAAGVTCTLLDGECVESIGYRLSDGPSFYEGRFEVCRNNTWLSVCDVGADAELAVFACNARAHLGDDVTPVYGSGYGPGTGAQLAVCMQTPFLELVLVDECSSNPDVQRLCSHDRDAGVRCQPGLLSMSLELARPSTNFGLFPVVGSTNFTLQCSAIQSPWEAKLVSTTWYRFGVPVQTGESITEEVIEDSYNPSVFSLSYTYRSELTFNRPLLVRDRGQYSCNVSVELTYPDNSTYLLSNSTSYPVIVQVPSPSLSVEINGSQFIGTRLEVHCFVELPDPALANYVIVDFFDGSFVNISALLEQFPDITRLQVTPLRQYNETHVVLTITAMPLQEVDQDTYYCVVNYNLNDSYVSHFPASHPFLLRVFSNDTDEGVPDIFLPFGHAHGDSTAPSVDDGSTEAIQLNNTEVVLFGTNYNRVYINTNGILAFVEEFLSITAPGNFDSIIIPPLIAPFWDDVNVVVSGTIFYRQDYDPSLAERLRREISAEYPEAELFHPSLVFVVTWDRVAPFQFDFRDLRNTFQAVIASDGIMTFIVFNYGTIRWGGVATLIGITAGDQVNFFTHPASFSTHVLALDDTRITYRVDRPLVSLPPPPPPIGVQGLCSVVVWSSPDVPCDGISGYDVRLYHQGHFNITGSSRHERHSRFVEGTPLVVRVPSNRTYYITRGEDHLSVSSLGEIYVQVRVIHDASGIGEWSEGISLGCEEPPTEPEVPRVYFELNGTVYGNNSVVSMSKIGEGTAALHCKTDNEDCCATPPNRMGEFYYPNGVKVPISRFRHGLYRNRGGQAVRLNRREGVRSPVGKYRCEVPNADNVLVNIYVTITDE